MNDQTEIPEVKAPNSLHRGAKEQKVESAGRAERTPLPCPSDWTFDLIEEYNTHIARVAEGYKLDIYPIQLEIITAEQMMDAYASVGMPVNYRHWSFGKHFLATEKGYRRGQMGLAYEIVINSNPCIAYLMEENTMTMQALVLAHAAYGHNSFFKGNYLFRLWTDAHAIVDYLVYAKNYVAECEERHGQDTVEELLDSCHALMHYGVTATSGRRAVAGKDLARQREREDYSRLRSTSCGVPCPRRKKKQRPKRRAFPPEPQENCFISRKRILPCCSRGARSSTHRAENRSVLLSAAPNASHERRLGMLLALHSAKYALRRGQAY
jgi:spore cortex formation protein SpoVR/YcgB (stage V sporulation)